MKQKKISTLLFTLTCSFTSISNTPVSGAQIFSKNQGGSVLKNSEHNQDIKENQENEWLQAAKQGDLKEANKLKNNGANIHAKDENGSNALHLACLSGNVAMVTWLLNECKLGIETKGYAQKTPFICAAQKGQLEIAKLLKQRDANINAKDIYKNNALHLACRDSSSLPMINWLLDVCKLDLETKGYAQKTLFIFAAQKGQLHVVKLLKQRGTNIHAKDAYGNNALHLACALSGKVSMINWLLDVCKIGIETKGQDEKTPFLFAAEKGQLAIAKLLRQRGADINTKDESGNNALHATCYYSDSVDMVNWLLHVCKIGIETRRKDQNTPFLCAAQNGQLAIANLLRKRGANINAKDEDDNNALHIACLHSGSVDMVNWLLDVCKIGLETQGSHQMSPFLCAVHQGQLTIAMILKERGADINAKDQEGDNALHLACSYSGSAIMTSWLLDMCHMGLETKGYRQKTPFLSAAQNGQLAIANVLKERGANINAKDEDGSNALHHACLYSGSEAMINWLLNVCKIGLESKGCNQKTPFLFAAQNDQLAIAKLLKQRGANINAKDAYGNNALHLTCLDSGSEAMINWLLDLCNISIETRREDQNTPFLCAAKEGQLTIAKLLRQRGANINAKNAYRDNALHTACGFSGNVAMTTWLLDVCKISIDTRGQLRMTSFLGAARQGQLEIAKLLKERGADINARDEDGNNALHLACLASDSVGMVTWLLDVCHMGIETKGQDQKTPFLCAAGQGQLAMAKLLRQRRANINAKDMFDNNALHLACGFSGSVDMTIWLLEVCKMDVDTRGQLQMTPFLCAARQGHLAITKLLKQRGANVKATDQSFNSALILAQAYSNDPATIKWLQTI